jgi:pantoate kinase
MAIFVPASITCFFAPVLKDPQNSGSLGVGITLKKGVYVSVSRNDCNKILFNGKDISLPTVEYVAKALGFKGLVEIKSDVPIGCGFGVSGASALGCAVAINRALGLNKSFFELADLAHEAEVLHRTGLGDVTTQCHAGVVVRKKASQPSECTVDRFLWDLELDILVMGELKTEELLSESINSIYKTGKDRLKEFLKKPSVENLFYQSKRFAVECGFLDSEIGDVIEAVESAGGLASMVMLGKAVFAVNGEILKEFKGLYFKTQVDFCGVRLDE